MDRSDELKGEREFAKTAGDEAVREGDVLGLGGSAVPKAPGDPTTEYDPESVSQRRSRALGDTEVRRRSDDQHGATGVDMGAGGHGTDLSSD